MSHPRQRAYNAPYDPARLAAQHRAAHPTATQETDVTVTADHTDSTTELDEQARSWVSRLAVLAEQRKALIEEEDAIKADIRSRLGVGSFTANGRDVLRVTPTVRFSDKQAEKILPPDLLRLCMATKVDATLAKKTLPPALYAACQAVSGEPTVRLV